MTSSDPLHFNNTQTRRKTEPTVARVYTAVQSDRFRERGPETFDDFFRAAIWMHKAEKQSHYRHD